MNIFHTDGLNVAPSDRSALPRLSVLLLIVVVALLGYRLVWSAVYVKFDGVSPGLVAGPWPTK